MSERDNRPEGIRDEIWQTIIEAENALSGKTSDEIPDVADEPEFDGTVLDENLATEREKEYVLVWLRKLVEGEIEGLSIKMILTSADETTAVTVYARALGENELYLAKFQNQGEKPSWVLWPDWQYEDLFGEVEE